MSKSVLIQSILNQLAAELEAYAVSARAAHEEATHEQSKAENKYDTRGLEAGYLAQGQSRQAAETEQSWENFKRLVLRDFTASDPIDIGALIELQHGETRCKYFMGPRAGGLEIEHEGSPVLIITPQSPLGKQLMGAREGDKFKMEVGRARETYTVVRVS